jgi:hypothetical protein
MTKPCSRRRLASGHWGGIVKPWYVAFLKGCVTVMRVRRHRSEAIALACDLLEQGIEVTRVGPMLETDQQEIDPVSIRRLWQQRSQEKRACSGHRIIDTLPQDQSVFSWDSSGTHPAPTRNPLP